jgi:hypothetical protein
MVEWPDDVPSFKESTKSSSKAIDQKIGAKMAYFTAKPLLMQSFSKNCVYIKVVR